MSIQAISWVLLRSKSRGYARLVLISLANYANDEGECWPAQRTIARDAGVSPGSVPNQLAALIGLGEIEVVDPGGPRRSARYRLPFAVQRSSAEHSTPAVQRSSAERSARPRAERSARPRGEQNRQLTVMDPPPVEPPSGGPDAIQSLVGRYVDEYRSVCNGADPSKEWRSIAGREIKKALANGETDQHVAGCLVVIARERKSPAQLAHVIADSHAGVPRRNP